MHADGLTGLEPIVEVVALHHPRHGVSAGQLNHAACAQGVAPFAVVTNFGLGGVQHQAGLLVIGFGVGLDLLRGQWRAGGVAARRVANHAGEVPNQKNHRMAQVLQLAHLVEHHGVPQVDVRGCGVQAKLDAQRFASSLRTCQLFDPLFLRNQLVAAPQRYRQRLANAVCHGMGGLAYWVHIKVVKLGKTGAFSRRKRRSPIYWTLNFTRVLARADDFSRRRSAPRCGGCLPPALRGAPT